MVETGAAPVSFLTVPTSVVVVGADAAPLASSSAPASIPLVKTGIIKSSQRPSTGLIPGVDGEIGTPNATRRRFFGQGKDVEGDVAFSLRPRLSSTIIAPGLSSRPFDSACFAICPSAKQSRDRHPSRKEHESLKATWRRVTPIILRRENGRSFCAASRVTDVSTAVFSAFCCNGDRTLILLCAVPFPLSVSARGCTAVGLRQTMRQPDPVLSITPSAYIPPHHLPKSKWPLFAFAEVATARLSW